MEKHYKTPKYTRNTQDRYRTKAPSVRISIEFFNLLDRYKEFEEESKISFSRRIAKEWEEKNWFRAAP